MKQFFILLAVLLLVVPCFPDTIYLKNGTQVDGEVEGETDDSYSVLTDSKFIYIKKAEVDRIEFTKKDGAQGVDWKAVGITAGGVGFAVVLFLLVRAGASY